jgi:hypothetical protein
MLFRTDRVLNITAVLALVCCAVDARTPATPYATQPARDVLEARPTGPADRPAATPATQPASGLTAQARIIEQQIAQTPSVVVDATPTAAKKPAIAPELGKAAPTSATLLYRPLDTRLEADVRELLAQQLKWPADDPDKQRRIAVFPGAVQPAVQGRPQMTLKAIASQDAPLAFDPVRRVFEGRIQVGFVELGAQGSERPLAGNFSFQVQGPVSTEPAVARVTSTAPPFQVIRVTSTDPGDEVRVTVRSSVNPDGVQLLLGVVRPEVELRITPRAIQGFGLEVADIVVSSRAPTVTRGQRIQLTSDGGRVEPLSIQFDDSGVATASIRSVSTGRATVTAQGAVLGSDAQASVDFVTPWSFIVAALAGGVTGGLLRKGTTWRTRRKRFAIEMLIAVLTGAVAFGLFALGVNVVGIRLPTHGGEVLVFIVAALGALLGTRIFGAAAPAERARGARP